MSTSNAESTTQGSGIAGPLDHNQTESNAPANFTLDGSPQPKRAGEDQAGSVKALRRVEGRRQLGQIVIEGKPVSVWFEDNKICFRRSHGRRIERISLTEVFYHAVGQPDIPGIIPR